jgi:hypothetical protein
MRLIHLRDYYIQCKSYLQNFVEQLEFHETRPIDKYILLKAKKVTFTL